MVPAKDRARLEAGQAPWHAIDLALATHDHRDHFNARSVAAFLKAHPKARLISTRQAISKLEKVLPPKDPRRARARGFWPEEGEIVPVEARGVRIRILNLHHGRTRRKVTENLGFLIELGGVTVLHIGDTEATVTDFAPYESVVSKVDVALLPSWFLVHEKWMKVVRKLAPKTILVMHMATPDAPASYFDPIGSRSKLIETIQRTFPNARVMTRFEETFRYPVD